MTIKSVVMISMFIVPLIIVNIGIVASPFLLFGLYILSGLGMAGIGMGVMHDAIHGSYSSNQKVNKIMSQTMNVIGASSTVWHIQHNVLHHTYTNIDEADDDINAPFFLRFSPHAKRYWLHRYQYLYVWFFYGLSTISWITSKDFVRLTRYNKMGLLPEGTYPKEIAKIIGWKVLYYMYTLIIPMIMLPFAPWLVLLAFLSMHMITGLLISLVFQTAHVMPSTQFPLPDKDGLIANNWTIHQLATTSNYSPRSRFFSWMIGGLNFQIEHHLYPNVCHVHYKKISRIVKATAEEYGVPYLVKRTFAQAISDHVKMLRLLGRMEMKPVEAYSQKSETSFTQKIKSA